MRKILLFSCILFLFCGHLFSQRRAVSRACKGVLINGVCWAESNVDRPGTFAATPEAYGMLYQWNRKKGWPATGTVSGWDNSLPSGESWEAANDPCPFGWRVPTIEEITALLDNVKVTSVWISQNGVYGRKVTDKATGNSIFLPSVSYRDANDYIDNPNHYGWYWSGNSSNDPIFAWILYFINTSYIDQINFLKIYGLSVRCVADPDFTDCDSIVRNTSATICAGDLPYTWGDTVFQLGTETGKFRFQHISKVTGCDSIVYLDLTVNPVAHLSFSDVVCSGSRYTKNGFNLPVVVNDTLVSDTLQSIRGCDSVRSLYLTVHPLHYTDLYDTVCAGDSYDKHGFNLPGVTISDSHTLSLFSRAGCDSIVILHLTVLPAVQQTLYDSVCPSARYVNHGFDLTDVTASRSFRLPLQTMYGCDSIIILDLHVYPSYLYFRSEDICEGDTIDFRGKRLYESGLYYDTLTTVKGCDSIYNLDLTVHPAYHIQLSGVFCEGSSYTEQGFDVSRAGVYHRYLKTISGCDSIVTLHLTEEKKIQGSIRFLPEDCTTHTYSFFFEPEIPLKSWQWEMGDGSVLLSGHGVHSYADSGVYRILLRTETFNGCQDTFSCVQTVPYYLPEVPFQADRQIIDEDFPTVCFRAEIPPEMICVWDFGDGKTEQGNRVSHTYPVNTEKYYHITLTVTNADSCITESRMQIEVAFLPKSVNTFSPNGDDINDIFMAGYRIEIMNRNGLQIYSGDNGWDGTGKDGQAPEDTYFYRIYYQTANGERTKTGYVTLVR